jgi:hypothetical protein
MTNQVTPTATGPNPFLQYAPTKYYAIQGSVPVNSGNGYTPVTWQQPIPTIPAYCTSIHLTIEQQFKVTFAANGDKCYISPYAPYSGWNSQLLLGGAPPWAPTELTPWYLDNITAKIDYDETYPGLGGINSGFSSSNFLSNILDLGPANFTNQIGSAAPATSLTSASTTDNLNPGIEVTNTSGGADASLIINATFNLTIRLKRKRHLMWGAVPFGDPENRPNFLMNLMPLVGINPEQCMFVSPSTNSASITAVLNAPATVTAVYELQYVDLVPNGVQIAEPMVQFALQLTADTKSGLAAGSYNIVTHRTAQAYTGIHHLLIDGGNGGTHPFPQPVKSDYFALWDDQDPQSARWSYDGTVWTLQMYYDMWKRVYRRPPILGHYVADLENGVFPEVPSVDPLDRIITPDATYAAGFGVPVTPAVSTVTRIPAGTTVVNPYVRTYSLGLVKVPY